MTVNKSTGQLLFYLEGKSLGEPVDVTLGSEYEISEGKSWIAGALCLPRSIPESESERVEDLIFWALHVPEVQIKLILEDNAQIDCCIYDVENLADEGMVAIASIDHLKKKLQ